MKDNETKKKIKEIKRHQLMCLKKINDPLVLNKDYYETQLAYLKLALEYYEFNCI
jgi:hypothetical protein